MVKKYDSNAQRLKRHKRVRAKLSGTAARPRLDVFRSNTHIYAQVIDDVSGRTLAAAGSNDSPPPIRLLRAMGRLLLVSVIGYAVLEQNTFFEAIASHSI